MQLGIIKSFGAAIMSAIQKPSVVFVLGSPGAGKGTQCKRIVEEFGYVHLSAGDLLRDERSKKDSAYGELIEEHIKNGTIVPVKITCKLIEKAMQNCGCSNKFLIDGFPRNQENLEGWLENMGNKVNLTGVLFLDCPEEVGIERCLGRGAKGSGRSDDNVESLKKRFDTYMNDTLPIISYFEQRDLVYRVDAVKSSRDVFDDIKNVFYKIDNQTKVYN